MNFESAKELAYVALREAELAGAGYAEARLHSSSGKGFMLKNGEPQPSVISDSFGIGIRVLNKGALAFSGTNRLDTGAVRRIAKHAVQMARASASLLKKPIKLDSSKAIRRKVRAEEKQKIEGADGGWLRSLLMEIESRVTAPGIGVKIPNRIMSASTNLEQKFYINTDGALVETRVPRFQFFGILTAIENGETAQRLIQQGESGGLEVVKRINLIDYTEEQARTLGQVLKKAVKPPTGTIDVILSPELSGIAAHESVGHPQEADRVLGREGAQAGESYLKRGSLGTKIGSSQANVADDPTLAHSNGFSPVDDEGVQGRKRMLIKEGVINEFLQNRSTAVELGVLSNGASRAVGFSREPIIRMSNTFVEPGDYTLAELLKEVKTGIYFASFTEWNIDDKRLNQRYVGLEAYLIERGEMGVMVKAPVLEITTPKLWSSVKARSKKLEFEAATCGKGDPMQGIPVWTGGPDTLLTDIKLGSR